MLLKQEKSSGISKDKTTILFNKWFQYQKNKLNKTIQKQTVSNRMKIEEIVG